MSGRLGNYTIGKRRGNESPVKRWYACQPLSRRSLINVGGGGSGLPGFEASNASGSGRRGAAAGKRQATRTDGRRITPSRSQKLPCTKPPQLAAHTRRVPGLGGPAGALEAHGHAGFNSEF
jgi:hypothetical protein